MSTPKIEMSTPQFKSSGHFEHPQKFQECPPLHVGLVKLLLGQALASKNGDGAAAAAAGG